MCNVSKMNPKAKYEHVHTSFPRKRESTIAATDAIQLEVRFRDSENRDCSLRCNDGKGFLYFSNHVHIINTTL